MNAGADHVIRASARAAGLDYAGVDSILDGCLRIQRSNMREEPIEVESFGGRKEKHPEEEDDVPGPLG